MSATKEATIWCDDCSEWAQESGCSPTQLRAKLKIGGWTRRGGVDRCDKCSAKLLAAEPAERGEGGAG